MYTMGETHRITSICSEMIERLTINNNLRTRTRNLELDATSTFCVVNATQCRNVLLTTLVHVHLTSWQQQTGH